MADPTPTPQQPPLANPSPRHRFQESANNVSLHRKMVDSHEFQRATDFAMLEYSASLSTQTVDFQGGAANHFKLRGALEFLQTLRVLAEAPPKIRVMDKDNLTQ